MTTQGLPEKWFMVPQQLEAADHTRPATKVQQGVQERKGRGQINEEDGGPCPVAGEGIGGGRKGASTGTAPMCEKRLRSKKEGVN